MIVYLALLRGINVGGNNVIKMTELARLFQSLGYSRVSTYIQSGNVIFAAEESDPARLNARLEEALARAFRYNASVILRSYVELQAVVGQAPPGFGSDLETYRCDVVFLKSPLTADEALSQVMCRPEVDQAWAGPGVLYFAKLVSRATQSYLPRVIGLPVYQSMTIRNWNTTTKLLALMTSAAEAAEAADPGSENQEPAQ